MSCGRQTILDGLVGADVEERGPDHGRFGENGRQSAVDVAHAVRVYERRVERDARVWYPREHEAHYEHHHGHGHRVLGL